MMKMNINFIDAQFSNHAEASILGDMARVSSLKFHETKSLEILYNVMQRPVGHDQRAYNTSMLR